MHGFKGERVLMRIHLEEQDKFEGRSTYEAIVQLLRERHFAGATVMRAILGFGASGHVHKDHVLAIQEDVPVVVEVVDTEERIKEVLPEMDRMVGGGLITLEQVRVILYRQHASAAERAEHERIEITGSWRAQEPER